MKIDELFNKLAEKDNKKLDFSTEMAIIMVKYAFGNRDIDLNELEKLKPGIKEKLGFKE